MVRTSVTSMFPPPILATSMVAVWGWEDAESLEDLEELEELYFVCGVNGGLGGWIVTQREGVRGCPKVNSR